MKKLLYTALLVLPLTAFSQEENGTGDDVKSVEIRVVEEYQAQVRAAHKISEQPSFSDTTSQKNSGKRSHKPQRHDHRLST